ncbi:uncharacterized protein C6orf136 homolog [Denticeps clupeoides]|uniref:Uncharacterized protein n=1 Tax=Denticeps clupeoides TaxID=299321 RepID=A0AAY4DJI2_9TELE|nr:uncharacterized protein C6orf136 homolog [Denticeps clupeoides]
MAVCRGGTVLWVGRVRGPGSRRQGWSLGQMIDVHVPGRWRTLSGASWTLSPPHALRYQSPRLPSLSHPFHHASRSRPAPPPAEDWEAAVSLCAVLRRGEPEDQRTLVDVPPCRQARIAEILAAASSGHLDLLLPLTTVDGRREDDISVPGGAGAGPERRRDVAVRERGSFRSLFESEGCPAPFASGSGFYCFHCPGTEPPAASGGLADGGPSEGDREGEEKLALMYERLRDELPSFFAKPHDYGMYSGDVEFINGILNTRTRGRVPYQLSLSLWRLCCLCYYAEARLEVLKLTRHPEDGTIRARWRVRGLPFHTLLLRFYRRDKSRLYRSYDAFSTFYLGSDGLIHCHRVEKVMQAQPPVVHRVTSLLAGALVALGVQEHRPALNLLPPLLSSLRQGRE